MADYAAEESHDTMVSDSTDTEYPMDMEDKDVRALHGDLEESRILIEQSVLCRYPFNILFGQFR